MQQKPLISFVGKIALVLIAVFGVYLLWRYTPVGNPFYPKCPSVMLFGIYCPGCGTARALHQLLHRHLWEAIRYNVLTVVSIGFLFAYARSPKLRQNAKVPRVVMWIVLVYFVARNIPYTPFLYLAPHGIPAPIFSGTAK